MPALFTLYNAPQLCSLESHNLPFYKRVVTCVVYRMVTSEMRRAGRGRLRLRLRLQYMTRISIQ